MQKKRMAVSATEDRSLAAHPRLLAIVKFNLRAMARLENLVLILLTALTVYYNVYTSLGYRGSSQDYWLMEASSNVSRFGDLGLHPLTYFGIAAIMQFTNLFTVVGLPIMAYLVACNLVNEDSGSLPSPLLFSKPVVRRTFLAVGFVLRFAIFAVFGYAVPFLIGYAQNVGELASYIGPAITTRITMEQWGAMAWGRLFWQLFAAGAAYMFATAALVILVAVVARRGLIAIPFTVALTFFFYLFAGPTVTRYTVGSETSYSFFGFLMAPFLLWASVPSMVGYGGQLANPPIMTLPQSILALFVYGSFLLLLTIAVFPRLVERG